MAQRLTHSAKALTAYRNDRNAQLLCHLLGHGPDIITNQSDRTFRLHGDALSQREHLLNFSADHLQLLISAEHDILFLKIAGNLHGGKIIDAQYPIRIIASGTPTVLPAADGTMANVHHVFNRAPYHTLGACISTAPCCHDAGP
ncbi:hypothetical protein D3C74_252610 [compost metagenome]